MIDYLLVFTIINLSGNSVLVYGERYEVFLVIIALIFLCGLVLRGRLDFDKRSLLVFFSFCLVFLYQAYDFNFFPIYTNTGFLVKLFIAFSCVVLIDRFYLKYVRVMYFICLIGLFFYSLDQFFHFQNIDFHQFFLPVKELLGIDERFNIGLYNFQVGRNYYRNSALFWEPGAFAGYILLALVFLALNRSYFTSSTYRKYLLIFFVSLTTTFSTQGYLLIPFVLLLIFNARSHTGHAQNIYLINYCFLIGLFFVVLTTFNLEFVSQKVFKQYEAVEYHETGWELTRYGSMLFDLDYIMNKPFFGSGIHLSTRYYMHPELKEFRMGNGLTDLIAKFGIFIFVLYVISAYRLFLRYKENKLVLFLSLFILIAILNGEWYMNYPIFLTIFFGHRIPVQNQAGSGTF